MKTTYKIAVTCMGVMMVFAAVGCSHAQESGFLGNYNGFKETGMLSKNLQYVNKDVNWSQYNAVMIDPVAEYLMPDKSDGQTTPPTGQEVRQLCSYYTSQLVQQFENYGVDVVHSSGPGVLEVRAAVTQLYPTNVAENATAQGASLIPGVGIAKEAYKGLTGSTLGMGQASMEVEFLDSVTKDRLFGYVAKKTGSSLDIKGQTSKWGVVEQVMKKWAAFLATKYKKFTDPSFDPSITEKMEQMI